MKKIKLCVPVLLAGLLALTGWSCQKSLTSDEEAAPLPEGQIINIQDFKFEPSDLTVKQGDVVLWRNQDSVIHTVTSQDGTLDSGNIEPGQDFSFLFISPGQYDYYCAIHPYMKGKIIVEGTESSAPETPAANTSPDSAASTGVEESDQSSPEMETTTLKDITGGSGQGTATRGLTNDLFYHQAMVKLPDPDQGYFYEGWLVRKNPFKFISTGKMTLEDGTYKLTFESPTNYNDFSQVVITIEPDDGNPDPDKHILEGEF